MLEHGGNPSEFETAFGSPIDGWLDLSTGINPNPYPAEDVLGQSWNALPTARELANLCQAAARAYGVGDLQSIVAAPGTQALIQTLPHLRGKSVVKVLSPTYGEHAHTWRQAGHTVGEITDLDDLGEQTDVLVLVNPNNPDGRTIEPDVLHKLSQGMNQRGGWLVVDEAFCDVEPSLSCLGEEHIPGLIVLRSFGKFFGLAGLRLGFALCEETLAEELRQRLGPWCVSSPAISAGTKALSDEIWMAETRVGLEKDARRLDAILASAGLDIIGGTSLYRLVSSEQSPDIFRHLAEQGIMVRRFEANPEWLRFGLPGKEADWQRLSNALFALSTHFDLAANQ